MPDGAEIGDEGTLSSYWYALGRFIHHYARLEHYAQIALRRFAGLSNSHGKALFPGMRTREAVAAMRRLSVELEQPLPPEVVEAFEKAEMITTQRDRILHHGINVYADGAVVSDAARMVRAKVRTDRISVSDIDDLNWDTVIVWARLLRFSETLPPAQPNPYQTDWDAAGQRPWRYKPPQPLREKSPPRTKQQQSPQPQSSPE